MANAARNTLEVTPRHLWLALLGGVGFTRRELCAARLRARAVADTLRAGSDNLRDLAWGVALTAQERLARPQRRVARRRTR